MNETFAIFLSASFASAFYSIVCFFFRITYREVKDDTMADFEEGRSTPVVTLFSRSGSSSIAGTTLSPSTPMPGTPSVSNCTVEDVLQLLRHLFVITTSSSDKIDFSALDMTVAELTPEQFTSKKITNKLLQQIQVSSFLCRLVFCFYLQKLHICI